MTSTAATEPGSAATRAPERRVLLLGPQHREPCLRDALLGFAPDALEGPVALVSAGWEEREAETADLERHLGVAIESVGLWPRCEDAFEEDDSLRERLFARYDRMRELARIYRMRLAPELDALRTLIAESLAGGEPDLLDPAIADAFRAVRELDAHHLARVAELDEEVFDEVCGRDAIRRRADEVRPTVESARTLLVAGGHVGILYNRMRLFGVRESLAPDATLVGWSGGGMVLTDRIVLFHDAPPQGPSDPEVHGPGLGLAPGVVALPHARNRLQLDDAARVSLLARRFAPDMLVALDDGDTCSRASGAAHWTLGGGARELSPDGRVTGLVQEAAR